MLLPIIGMFFGFLLLKEVPNMYQWVGAAVIFGGMGISKIKVKGGNIRVSYYLK